VFGDMFKEKILKSIFKINVKTSSLDSEIITKLILSSKANEITAEKKRLAQSANGVFMEYFPQAPLIGHPLSFYRWLPLLEDTNSQKFEANLLTKGIRVFHSDRFLSSSNTPDKFLRISLASTNSLDELRIGLKILKTQLNKK
jgi:DNA-binding transcriptional MocR family regulator